MSYSHLAAWSGKAQFVSGDPLFRDYTPSADVDAGDVIVIDGRPYVAHQAIAANTLGALAVSGGIYDLLKDGTGGPDIAEGEAVFWINVSELATDSPSGNVHFGPAVAAAGASVDRVRTIHDPDGSAFDS